MGITFGAASSAHTNPDNSTLAWSHTIGSGDNRVLIIGVAIRNNRAVSSITYGSQSLTKVRNDNPGVDVRTELWYLLNPALGTNTVTITVAASTTIAAGAISYSGVSAIGNNGGGTGTAQTSSSITVTSLGGNLVVDVLGLQSTGILDANGPSQTVRVNEVGTANHCCMSEIAGSPSTSMGWTFASDTWAESGVELVAVPTASAIGYTDTRVSFTPKSKYKWFLYLDGQLYADITGIAENRAFSQSRNDSDHISFSASIDMLNAYAKTLNTNIASLFQAASTEVRVYRYDIPFIAGELSAWNSNVGGDRKLQLNAVGWLDLFKWRRTSDSFAGSNSGLTIAQSLITTTLAKTNGAAGNYSGLTIGLIPSPDLSTVFTNQTYDQKTVYDGLLEMANDANGFDVEVTWDKRINFYYPHVGVSRPDIVFTYPNGNVKDIQLSIDPTKLVNSLTARGKGSGADQVTLPFSDSASQMKYGLREDVLDYSNISDTTLLTQVATADLNVYKQPLTIQKVVFDGSGRVSAPQVGTFHIGDLVNIYVNNMGIYPDISQSYIIDKIEVAIGDKDEEDVTLTLGNPNLPANGV